MVFRVFSWIIWLVFFLVLVLVTFFSGGNSGLQAVPVQTQEIWIFSLNGSWQLSSASEVLPDTSGLSFERFTDVDSIYFAPWSEYERDISSLEAGSIYINTQDEKNHVFLSLDTLVNVWLTDDNQDITYVDLYPHMYLRLNPSRIQFLKNADLVRISSVFDLWSLTWSLNNDIISWFLANTWIKSSDLNHYKNTFIYF